MSQQEASQKTKPQVVEPPMDDIPDDNQEVEPPRIIDITDEEHDEFIAIQKDYENTNEAMKALIASASEMINDIERKKAALWDKMIKKYDIDTERDIQFVGSEKAIHVTN